jgi:hypothetical protein
VKTLRLGPPVAQDDEGTVSPLREDGRQVCLIAELPDRQNKKDRSRINAGRYYAAMEDSPHHGHVYRLHKYRDDGSHDPDVDGHTHVLVHIGNVAGDVDMGYASDSEACMLPGTSRALFRAGEQVGRHLLDKDQHGVASSGVALKALLECTGGEPFILDVDRG